MQFAEISKKGNVITNTEKITEAIGYGEWSIDSHVKKVIDELILEGKADFVNENYYLKKDNTYIMTHDGFWHFVKTYEIIDDKTVQKFNSAFHALDPLMEYISRDYIIYQYTSPSGKMYVGKTNNEVRRKRQHRNRNTGCPEFGDAVMKYGYVNFEYEVLERYLTKDDADEREAFYIKKLNTLTPNGYNMVPGKNVKKEKRQGKYFKQLIAKVLAESESEDWYEAKNEWFISDYQHIKHGFGFETCVCGNHGITHLYTITNSLNGNEISPLGSTCVEKFDDEDMNKIIKLQAESERLCDEYKRSTTLQLQHLTRFLIDNAYKNGAFANTNGYDQYDDYDFLKKMFNKRNTPTPAQQRKINVIMAKSIIPYFTGDDNVKFIGQVVTKQKPKFELETET